MGARAMILYKCNKIIKISNSWGGGGDSALILGSVSMYRFQDNNVIVYLINFDDRKLKSEHLMAKRIQSDIFKT